MSAICSFRSRAQTVLESSGLACFRTILRPQDVAAAVRDADCAPQRSTRCLTPEVVSWLMMLVALHTESMTQGLIRAWRWIRPFCPRCPSQPVTEEAFCQARADLPLRFWRSLWANLRQRYESKFGAEMLWKGFFRVLAADGSDVNLPIHPQLVEFFGRPKNGAGYAPAPPGPLLGLCSVFTGFCVAFRFLRLRFSEHVGLRHLIRVLRPNDLLLTDRGLFSYVALWHIRSRKAHFLMRISNQIAGLAERIQRLGSHEWMVRLCPSADCRRRWPGLPAEFTARLIRYQIRGFRPSWLLTSLRSGKVASRTELVELYHRRWAIETIWREWKHGLDIQNLRSKTPAGIFKEVHAQLLLSNLVRWVMTEATAGTPQCPLDLSFLTALTLVKNTISILIWAPAQLRLPLYQQLLADIRAAQIRKRPGRSYPRPADGKIRSKGHGKYQLPARLKKKIA